MAFKKNQPGCPCCDQIVECTSCAEGTTPESWSVEISGVNDTIPSCASCASVNATYVLTREANPLGFSPCVWVWVPESYNCAFPNEFFGKIWLTTEFGTIKVFTSGGSTSWQAFVDFPLECSSVSGVVLPNVANSGACNFFGSTATVTAL